MEELIFKVEDQLINVRQITELDNHYLAAITVVID